MLRKSRTHRRSQESLELQPLNATSANTKGMLKRMSRVKSHDLSQEENTTTIDQHQNEAKVPSPLGAGLPLLHRLRLVNIKEDFPSRNSLNVDIYFNQFADCSKKNKKMKNVNV